MTASLEAEQKKGRQDKGEIKAQNPRNAPDRNARAFLPVILRGVSRFEFLIGRARHKAINMGEILTAASILVGAALVAIQLFLQRRWDIQRSTEEITNRFNEPAMYHHWNLIYPNVIKQRKKWDDISDDEQRSVRALLSYFETIGYLLRRRVIDRSMIVDLFGDVIRDLHNCTREYLPRLRKERQSDAVYIEFESLAKLLGGRQSSTTTTA